MVIHPGASNNKRVKFSLGIWARSSLGCSSVEIRPKSMFKYGFLVSSRVGQIVKKCDLSSGPELHISQVASTSCWMNLDLRPCKEFGLDHGTSNILWR